MPVLLSWLLLERYRRRRPSGRNCGQRYDISPFATSMRVSGTAAPPDSAMRRSAPTLAGRKAMVPLVLQVPPRGIGAGAIRSQPADSAILLSCPPAKRRQRPPVGLPERVGGAIRARQLARADRVELAHPQAADAGGSDRDEGERLAIWRNGPPPKND